MANPSLSNAPTADAALQAFLDGCRGRVEAALEARLPPAERHPASLHAAMRYATLGGGKRIRPVLAYAGGQAVGAEPDRVDIPACAVELIHAYSLIHDDLPAMDNDDLRRGRATCHRVYGEAEAILAGDALQSLAYQLLAEDPALEVPAEIRLRMVEQLARAAGSRGMAGGQSLDLAAEGQRLSLAELEDLHIHKTGALIRASVLLGALAAGAVDAARLEALDHYAKCIGLAFQIQDDILDVEGSTDTLGKTAGSDVHRDKATYPGLLGLSEARERALELVREARAGLAEFDAGAEPLRQLAGYIVARRN